MDSSTTDSLIHFLKHTSKKLEKSLGHENPPYLCDWTSPEAPEFMVVPWGNDGSLDGLGEYFLRGSGPQEAHWKLGLAVSELPPSRSVSLRLISIAPWCAARQSLSRDFTPFPNMDLTDPYSSWWFIVSRLAHRSEHGLSGDMNISGSG